MALIKCPECSKEISDKATSCPGCGAPQTNLVTQEPVEPQPIVKTQPKEKKMLCPKCYSDQLTSDKKGFSAGKAIAGGLLVGPLGLAGGLLGSKKLVIYCVACGHNFKPGKHATRKPTKKEKEQETKGGISVIVGIAVWVGVAWMLGMVPAFQSHHLAGWIGFIAGVVCTGWLIAKWK